MLATISPRWPKAFTKIGFGTLAIFLYYSAIADALVETAVADLRSELETVREWQYYYEEAEKNTPEGDDFLESLQAVDKQLNDLENTSFLNLVMPKITALEEKEAFIYGLALLFVSYLCGEILIYLGSYLSVLVLWEKNYARRTARVAHVSNPIIQKQFEDLETLQTIVSALMGLVIVSVVTAPISYSVDSSLSSTMGVLAALGTIVGFTLFAAVASARMARTLDLTLDELSSMR